MDGLPTTCGKPETRSLVIGLVNNMSMTGMAATYEQFSSALADAGYPFKLRHLTLKDERDAPEGCTAINGFPEDEVTALIVTGMEPLTNDLRDEWLWPRLVTLHDWCEQNCVPVIWSCLSAHAAVLHSDRIFRQRLDTKLSGVFNCVRVTSSHPLLKAMPEKWDFPHSRYNSLPEEALISRGYAILSRSGPAGVDIFARMDGTPFFYFQGHPEYKPDTLLREYLRDTRRFASGESTVQPVMPSGYLDAEDEQSLAACCTMKQDSFTGQPDIMPFATQFDWREARRQLFRNWMDIAAAYSGKLVEPLNAAAKLEQAINSFGAAGT